MKIGVIGLGYVGLPLVCNFLRCGKTVYGFDIDKAKIKNLRKKKLYIDLDKRHKKIFNNSKNFYPFSSFNKISEVEYIVICLPTPLKNNKPDLSYVTTTIKNIYKFLVNEQSIVLESTTYPGSTDKFIINFLRKKNFIDGKNIFVGYSPEREDPGNKKFINYNIPKIIGANNSNSLNKIRKLYSNCFKKIVTVEDIATAEAVKITENVYRCINIALVNELKIIFSKIGIDIWKVIEAAKTKPFGYQSFYPGPGMGGHCIPIDPFYLSWLAKKNNLESKFIESAGHVNKIITEWIVKKVFEHCKKKKIDLKQIVIVGISYKKNIGDIRESPSLKIINLLKKKQIQFEYYDPFFKKFPSSSSYKINFESKKNLKFIKKSFQNKVVLLLCDHDNVNYVKIKNWSKLIFDTRNVYRKTSKKIIKL